MNERVELTQHNYDQMFVELKVALDKARSKHGNMCYISGHEILGKLHEEANEFNDEIIANDLDKQIKELHIKYGYPVLNGAVTIKINNFYVSSSKSPTSVSS